MLRKPPDVLITTPESLYLMLTSRAREFLVDAESVIVDEIHAVARTKRGAHLALTLERLEHLAEGAAAAHRPVGHPAPARGGRPLPGWAAGASAGSWTRACASRSTCEIQVPVEDMREPDAPTCRPPRVGTAAGGGDRWAPGERPHRRSIWPAIYPELLELVQEHRSTIIFVNARRGAERLAVRLNELAGEDGQPADDRPRPPRLARARGAAGGRGPAQVRRAALPGGHLLARARHRHGRRGPGAPGGVAEVGDRRAAAHRARRPRRRRGLEGPHLPQVPRRPARVRGGREAHARRRDRADRGAAQPARRARPADRGDDRPERGRVARAGAARAGPARLSLRRAVARAARQRARHARRPLPLGGVRRAAAADRLGPGRGHDPRAQGRAPARGDQRRHDPRPRALRRAPARRPARGRARRGDGLRGAPRPDLPARRLDLADRGDHPRPGDRHARARGARGGAVLARRRGRPAGRAGPGDRRVLARGGRPRARRSWRTSTTSTSAPRRTWSPTCASSRRPRAWCRATARS